MNGTSMTKDMWQTTLVALKATVGTNNFSNWIAPLAFSEANNGIVTFDVPTTFIGNYVQQNFGDQIMYQMTRQAKTFSVWFSKHLVPHVPQPLHQSKPPNLCVWTKFLVPQ